MNALRTIDPLSCVPIQIEALIQFPDCEEKSCGHATASVVTQNSEYFLVTNYHVVSGRRSTTNSLINDNGGLPTHLRCHFHGKTLGTWEPRVLPLYNGDGDPNSDNPLWRTFTISGSSSFRYADVAVLPLAELGLASLYPISMENKDQIKTSPCSRASVVGFPGARRSYKFFPIFVTGYVASEPELPYDDMPIMLVNATTTDGMSGSPVFQIEDGSYQNQNGATVYNAGRFSKFLGIYSGRIPEVSLASLTGEPGTDTGKKQPSILNIGIVWKPSVIQALLDR